MSSNEVLNRPRKQKSTVPMAFDDSHGPLPGRDAQSKSSYRATTASAEPIMFDNGAALLRRGCRTWGSQALSESCDVLDTPYLHDRNNTAYSKRQQPGSPPPCGTKLQGLPIHATVMPPWRSRRPPRAAPQSPWTALNSGHHTLTTSWREVPRLETKSLQQQNYPWKDGETRSRLH